MEEKMTPHEARAAELFLSGAVCAQAVFCAFCDLHGLDFETASRLSSSMGGGVGRLREVCGAFSDLSTDFRSRLRKAKKASITSAFSFSHPAFRSDGEV